MKTLKTTLAIALIILTAISCKKEKKQDPQPIVYPKYYAVQYKAEILGTNVTGTITYWDIYQKKQVTENITSGVTSRYFTFKEGDPASLSVSAYVTGTNVASATAEIYVDNTRRHLDVDSQYISAHANINCTIN